MPQLLLFKTKLWFHFEWVMRKTQIVLQVWNLSAKGSQIMRAAELQCSLRQQEHSRWKSPWDFFIEVFYIFSQPASILTSAPEM